MAEDAGLQEAADALWELEGAAMLGDDQAAGGGEWRGAEKAEGRVVLLFFGVGRSEGNERGCGVGGARDSSLRLVKAAAGS